MIGNGSVGLLQVSLGLVRRSQADDQNRRRFGGAKDIGSANQNAASFAIVKTVQSRHSLRERRDGHREGSRIVAVLRERSRLCHGLPRVAAVARDFKTGDAFLASAGQIQNKRRQIFRGEIRLIERNRGLRAHRFDGGLTFGATNDHQARENRGTS